MIPSGGCLRARPGNLWRLRLWDSSPASAGPVALQTGAETSVGKEYYIIVADTSVGKEHRVIVS